MSQIGTKKSKRGCKKCKGRHVKCDEQAPCSNCVRRNEECSLLEPSPSDSETTLDPALPSSGDEWIEDLALMHHYTRNTILVGPLGHRAETHALWRDYIPQQAGEHKFLMHGLLALAALHLASMHPEQARKYARLCDKHQTIALAKYRSILASASEVDMNSADALFAFSTTLSVSAMARSCSPMFMSQAQTIEIDAIVELFYLTRGVRDVIDLCHTHIRSGPMSQMFHGHIYPDGTVATLPSSVAAQFHALHNEMLPTAGLDPEALEHCRSALTELEDVYKNIVYFSHTENGLESGQVWRWSVAISSGFLRLIQARIPAALVILTHFAAATNAIRMAWYTENWGTYAFHGIETELDPQYLHWLEWPREQAAEQMAVLGVEVPDDDGRRPLIGF